MDGPVPGGHSVDELYPQPPVLHGHHPRSPPTRQRRGMPTACAGVPCDQGTHAHGCGVHTCVLPLSRPHRHLKGTLNQNE